MESKAHIFKRHTQKLFRKYSSQHLIIVSFQIASSNLFWRIGYWSSCGCSGHGWRVVTPAAGGPDNDDDQQDGDDHPDNHHHLHVLPPVLPLQLGGLGLELGCSILQVVGSLVKLGQLAVPLQHLLHVDPHDVNHLPHLGLCLGQPLVPLLWIITHVGVLVLSCRSESSKYKLGKSKPN